MMISFTPSRRTVSPDGEKANLFATIGPSEAGGIVLSGYRKSVQMARMAIGFEAFKNGCIEGDLDRGVLPLGQCTGLIEDTPSVAEVIDRIVEEAETARTTIDQVFETTVGVG